MTAQNRATAPSGSEPENRQADKELALSAEDLATWRAELMDPESWAEILSTYGKTMRLAVGLADTDGNLAGPCHNPQPFWTLARAGISDESPREPSSACEFCLAPESPCTAVTDSLRSGEIVYVNDGAGLAHASIPLLLGNQRLGALIAGQCFSQYPQPLRVRRAAKHCGASPHELWDAAVHQVPVSQATLHLCADLLAALGAAFLRQRYAGILGRQILRTNERYRLMIDGSPDLALFTVDHRGRVNSWNPGAAALLGYTEPEITGRDYSVFYTPEDVRIGVPAQNLRHIEESGWIEKEGWKVRKDGTRFCTETIMAKLGEDNASEYGFLLRDVTKARQVADAVLQAQKLESIGVLAGGIAHDFNNLLTSILGNLNLARVELPPGDPARPLLEIAERSSVKAAALIGQLLSYAGKGPLIATGFDLSGLVSEILPLIETSIPKSVRLLLSLPRNLPWILADSSEIQQIIMNLVINAAEALGPGGGRVEVSTGMADPDSDEEHLRGGVYLEVRDSGCGMDEATQRKIFDPFFTTKFTGRGLGLAAVSGIVRRLKGRLDLESAPGKGTTFRIVFPGVPASMPVAKTTPKSLEPANGLILVVDDDPLILNMVRTILERSGYSVMAAENGEVAVEAFRVHADRISAVLMDLTMPVMGGEKAFRLMNEIRSDIPIVISTGFGETSVRELFEGAVAGIIQKPYSVLALRTLMADVITLRESRGTLTQGASGL